MTTDLGGLVEANYCSDIVSTKVRRVSEIAMQLEIAYEDGFVMTRMFWVDENGNLMYGMENDE